MTKNCLFFMNWKEFSAWSLLGVSRPSRHCKGKKEKIIAYDHTGYLRWECECGHKSNWTLLEAQKRFVKDVVQK